MPVCCNEKENLFQFKREVLPDSRDTNNLYLSIRSGEYNSDDCDQVKINVLQMQVKKWKLLKSSLVEGKKENRKMLNICLLFAPNSFL